jgi:adenylate cyclase
MTKLLNRLKRHAIQIGLGLLVTLVFLLHAAQWISLGFIDQMELIAYDARLALSTSNEVDDRIVIVDLDDKSLSAEGRWPWPRSKVARLVEQLFEKYKIGLLGFDVVFAEPDESSGLKVLEGLAAGELASVEGFREKLEELRPALDNDRIFADTVARYPVVLGYYFNPLQEAVESSTINELPPPVLDESAFKGRRIPFHVAGGYGANLPLLQKAALGTGSYAVVPDTDGIVRRVPMLWEYEDVYYESLSLVLVRHALGGVKVAPGFGEALFKYKGYSGLEWLQVGDRRIPVDARASTLIPFRGRQGSFPYVSATDVLSGTADAGTLEGRIVLIGTSAPGLVDLRATPVQEDYPGVEVHANLIAGILDGNVKEKPAYALGAEVIILTGIGLVMACVLPMLSPLWATLVTLSLVIVSFALNFVIWTHANEVIPIASGLMMLGLMFLLNMSYGFFVETRGKRQITGLFGQYVPPELVDEMADNPAAYSLDAESRELTVLFSDVRGFTTLSEGLPPQQLAELMNMFLTPMTRVIHENRGTIDKYMGDAIMAFWGAPVEDPEHARHAILAAMGMMQKIDEVNAEFKRRGWPSIRIGIGINTGAMSVGNMGSEFRMAYTVLGDAVNLGSRLEGLTKGYGVSIVVSETTKAAAPDFAYRELDRVRVKGKDKPVVIYEPLGPAEQVSAELKNELGLYKQGLKYYRAQDWDMAELQFLNLQKNSRSSALYQVYADRVAYFRQNPPGAQWDGVFTHTTK